MMNLLVAIMTYHQRFSVLCNHNYFPRLFSFQIFYLVYMMHFIFPVFPLITTQFTAIRFQSAIGTSYWFRLICSVFQYFNYLVYLIFAESVCRIIINTSCPCAIIGVEILKCHIVNIWTEQIPKEFGKHFIMVIF